MKYIWSIIIILVSLIACDKDLPSRTDTSLSVSKDAIYLSADAGVETLHVTASEDWRIEGIPEWCGTVLPSYGGAGEYEVKFRGRFYEDVEDRSAVVSFICGDKRKDVTLTQYGAEKFSATLSSQYIPSAGGEVVVSVESTSEYQITIRQEGDWLKKTTTTNPLKGDVVFEASANTVDDREAVIIFSIPERGFSKELKVTQLTELTENRYLDGEVIEIQKSTRENYRNIVILGDGFRKQDLAYDGPFKSMVDRTVSALFSCEPMASYRDYFSIYAVAAESEESGTGVVTPKNTALQTYFLNEIVVTLNVNDQSVYRYMEKTGINDRISTIVIVLVNTTRTGGVTITWSDGRCISLCTDATESNGLEGIIRHEVVGHSIGKLDEEYMYMSGSVTEEFITSLKARHAKGQSLNIDTTNDPEKVAWKHFISVTGYEKVGCYWWEGGCIFSGGGVCKSENAPSCMANNCAYFDAPSREQIVKHIKESVGEIYSFEDFIKEDKLRGK